MKEFVKSITSPYEKELIETRRYLHRHPELSFQETDTAAYRYAAVQVRDDYFFPGLYRMWFLCKCLPGQEG